MDIPSSWLEALKTVQKYQPEAVILGGALRDLMNERPIKDIDIFAQTDDVGDLYNLHEALFRDGWSCDPIEDARIYPVGEGNEVVGCFDAHVPGLKYPVNVIMIRTAADLLERIDFGLCRIAHNGAELIVKPEYTRDRDSQVFRLCQERVGAELAASVHRYARLSRKYEGWKFVPFMDDFDAMDILG